MTFFQKLKLLFKSKDEAPQLPQSKAPLDLRLGAMASMDSAFSMLTSGISNVRGFGRDQEVCAKGLINLGQGVNLHRFYLEDEDFMLQVRTSGGDDNYVEEVILFNYDSLVTINTPQELARLAGRGSLIGLPTYQFGDQTYQRTWGTEPGMAELVQFNEQVVSNDEPYTVQHLSMLYTREIDLKGRTEFLLFSVEETEGENGGLATQLSTAIGITLFANDIKVI
jgi:hypothetical protein